MHVLWHAVCVACMSCVLATVADRAWQIHADAFAGVLSCSLFELFSRYGNVEDAFIPSDRETGRSRGFGFVTLEAGAASAAAAALNETEFMVGAGRCMQLHGRSSTCLSCCGQD